MHVCVCMWVCVCIMNNATKDITKQKSTQTFLCILLEKIFRYCKVYIVLMAFYIAEMYYFINTELVIVLSNKLHFIWLLKEWTIWVWNWRIMDKPTLIERRGQFSLPCVLTRDGWESNSPGLWNSQASAVQTWTLVELVAVSFALREQGGVALLPFSF